jgi:hypothetical protein
MYGYARTGQIDATPNKVIINGQTGHTPVLLISLEQF